MTGTFCGLEHIYRASDYVGMFAAQQEKNDLAAMAHMVAPVEFAGTFKFSEMLVRDPLAEAGLGCCPFNGDGIACKYEQASEDMAWHIGDLMYPSRWNEFRLPRPFRYPCHHKVKDYGRGVGYADTARPALSYDWLETLAYPEAA